MSHVINGRTYRDALTTNNVEPQRPQYPAVRTPAKGPIITTHDTPSAIPALNAGAAILRETRDEAEQAGLTIAPKKSGRPKKAE